MPKINSSSELEHLKKEILSKRKAEDICLSICDGTGCNSSANQRIIAALRDHIERNSLKMKVIIKETGCHGFCEQGPIVVIYPEGICYVKVKKEDVPEIISVTLASGKVLDRLVYTEPDSGQKIVHQKDIPFYKNQMRLLTINNSKIDPRNIEDYIAAGGYSALTKALKMSPEHVIKEIKDSGLRGRSGGGFPVGRKWEAGREAEGHPKVLICNCHEGDPGAFPDRRIMEGNPHVIIEGMLIGAYAIGASEGYIFVGNEFPLTVSNTRTAIKQAEEQGLLGNNILGSGLNFDLKVYIDAGGYVCGESSALMTSMEGNVGEPRTKYDHATERGLWAKPTVLNNLQTWANVPLVINEGSQNYSKIGTENSKGTRVFSLVGKVKNMGLVEVPMGMTLREVVFKIGGGIRGDKKFKAVQGGGPLGGFVPEKLLDLSVDFNELSKSGLSMGPSLIVLDEDICIVDMVRYYLTFLAEESCGKCTPCRDGLRQMLKILTRISEGNGRKEDIALLEILSEVQKEAALCALGQGASGPVRSAMVHFRDEIEIHINEKQCPSHVCEKLSAPVPHKRG